LAIVPEYLVISSQLPTAPQAAQDVIAGVGARVTESQAITNVPDHWLLRLEATLPQAVAAQANLRADPRFEFASTAFRQVEDTYPMLPVNRIVVRFRGGVTLEEIDSLNAVLGTRVLRPPRPDSGFVEYWLALPAGAAGDPLLMAAAYYEHPLVRYAHPDMISRVEPQSVPSDPYYTQQYYLKNDTTLNGVHVDINVEPAWDAEPTKGCGVPSSGCQKIAVIDDGVQAAHQDFGLQVEFGYDVFGNNTFGCFGCANNPSNEPSHGTRVAGIIAGQHDNGIGIAGVAPGAFIVPVRIFRPPSEGLPATDGQLADGIRFAWSLGGAGVLNNSWGYTNPAYAGNDLVTNAINDGATQGRNGKGAIIVFSAGNSSNRDGVGFCGQPVCPVLYPARLANVIAVSAINRDGLITNYSPEGSEIDVVAPSSHRVPQTDNCTTGDVVSTDLVGNRGCNDGPNEDVDYTQTFGGTSAAAPQVSGIAQLLVVKEPQLSATAIRDRIRSSADPWGPSNQFGGGKVNAYRTLVPALAVTITGISTIKRAGTYTWTTSVSGGSGSYTYTWERSDNGGPYVVVGNAASYSNYEDVTSGGRSFTLKVTVISGGETAVDYHAVNVITP